MRFPPAGHGALLLLGSILAPLAFANESDAFSTPEEAAQVNDRTVGVVLSREELLLDLVGDLASEMELAADLRIVPILGKNHVESVYDLLYLKGVDLTLVRSDSIEYVRRIGGMASAQRLTHNVVRVSDQKIVVIAGDGYTYLDELGGKPVGFGPPGSGEFVTATLLFDTLGIEPEAIEVDHEAALAQVKSGELAAMVYLLDAPGALPGDAEPASGDAAPGPGLPLTVLALPRGEELSTLYRFTALDDTDMPGFIAEGEAVSTYSVDVNLVAYAWNESTDRTRRMERFVEALVDRLENLQEDAYQPTWKGVSLTMETPNVYSSPMVARALAEREAVRARLLEEKKRAEEEKRRAEAEAAAKAEAERIAALVARRDQVIARLGDELGEDDSARMERLLDEIESLLEGAGEDVDDGGTDGEAAGDGAATDDGTADGDTADDETAGNGTVDGEAADDGASDGDEPVPAAARGD